MAHLVKLGALTDELVSILTSYAPHGRGVKADELQKDPKSFNNHKELALRSLRSPNYPRTNHFEVQRDLEGLEEKFRVLDKDDLADALHDRLEEIQERSNKWTPEILHLLLQLSDQPVKKSVIEDLDFLQPAEVHYEPLLRWEDLVREDPELREKSIWKNIDYGVESSEEEYSESEDDGLETTVTSAPSTLDEYDIQRPNEFVVHPDAHRLQSVKDAQFWFEKVEKTPVKKFELFPQKIIYVTELQAIREVVFMLFSLPTSLFAQKDSRIQVVTDFRLKHSSPEAFHRLLSTFAEYGTLIASLRAWSKAKQSVPLLQSLQDQIARRLRGFDAIVSSIQEKYTTPKADTLVSLMDISVDLEDEMRVVTCLAEVIQRLQRDSKAQDFRCLELLYDATCAAQMAGEEDVYGYIGRLFFDCFNVYLGLVRTWMEQGELRKDDKVFFVMETDLEIELISIWQDRFKLRKSPEGILHAPRYIAHLASRIFNTGKSVVVLKELGRFQTSTAGFMDDTLQRSITRRRELLRMPELILDFDTVCSGPLIAFAPFSELFDVAINDWIQSKRHSVSNALRQCLFDQCGLNSALNALEKIYFMSDGATSSQFTRPIFEKLDTGKASWNDRFTLSELAQSTIGSLNDVSFDHLRASTIIERRYATVLKARKSVKSLAMLSLRYRMPWPVQIIISKDAIITYQMIFTILLQVRRSSHLLELRLLHDPANVDSSVDERALYYSLRSRLLWFTSTLYQYLTEIVIHTNTSIMRGNLAEAEDVDQMIDVHRNYMKRLRDQALLGTRLEPIRRSITSILDLSIRLSEARASHAATQQLFSTSTSSFRGTNFRRSTFKTSKRQASASVADSSSEDEDDDEPSILEPEDDNGGEVMEQQDYIDKLKIMRGKFDHLLRFVMEGLRGVARAGGEPNWEVLAVMLHAGIPTEKY